MKKPSRSIFRFLSLAAEMFLMYIGMGDNILVPLQS